jgi:DnaJ like chaperone protein
MSKYAKWIGGALGWGLGGPIGGILGFVLGAMVGDDSLNVEERMKSHGAGRHQTTGADFDSALLILSAAVMKADGRVMRSELTYVRNYFVQGFGEERAAELIGVLKEILKQDFDLREVCEQIRHFMQHPMRLQLMHYLFGIATADGNVDLSETRLLEKISTYLGLTYKDFESLKAMFVKDKEAPYRILEIDPSASDEEVKAAFRRMARKYHPDKLTDLGEEHVKKAQEKFIKVSEAYEQIKKERGIV